MAFKNSCRFHVFMVLALTSLLSCKSAEDEGILSDLVDKSDKIRQTLLRSNRCKVTININGQVKKVDENGSSYEYPLDLGAGSHAATGSFTDNTFLGSWDANYDGGALNYSGSVSVTLRFGVDIGAVVEKVTWQEDRKSYLGNVLKLSGSFSFTGYEIRLNSTTTPYFQSSGKEACDKIAEVRYFEHDYENSTTDTLVSYSCGETEYVRIMFWEE